MPHARAWPNGAFDSGSCAQGHRHRRLKVLGSRWNGQDGIAESNFSQLERVEIEVAVQRIGDRHDAVCGSLSSVTRRDGVDGPDLALDKVAHMRLGNGHVGRRIDRGDVIRCIVAYVQFAAARHSHRVGYRCGIARHIHG